MEFSYQYEYGEKEIEVAKKLTYQQLIADGNYKRPWVHCGFPME